MANYNSGNNRRVGCVCLEYSELLCPPYYRPSLFHDFLQCHWAQQDWFNMPGHSIEFVQNLQTAQSNRKLHKGY